MGLTEAFSEHLGDGGGVKRMWVCGCKQVFCVGKRLLFC